MSQRSNPSSARRPPSAEQPRADSALQLSVADFLDAMRVEAGLSRNAIAAYRSDLGALGGWLADQGVADWSELETDHIYDWLGSRRAKGAAESSVARGLVALRMLVRFLVMENQLKADPTARIQAPKLARLLPSTLSPEDVERLLSAFLVDGAPPGWRASRDTALLEVLYAAGARISEALGLTTDDLPPDLDALRLHGKGDKMRMVPLGRSARAALRRWIDGDRRPLAAASRSSAVFLSKSGRALDRSTAWSRVKEAAKLAGLPSGVSPHDLRHSFASHMLAGGADLRSVQEMLGHASIRTTEIYTHLDEGHVRAIHRMHHPRG